MSFTNKSQCINCDVKTCRYHSAEDKCELDSIRVAPRCDCHSGDCDESECASYHAK